MRTVNSLIGGADIPASNGNTFDRKNPVSGDVVTRGAAATLQDADAAVAAAANAFPAWAALSPRERRMRLLKAADELQSRAAEFAAIGVEETGGTAGWFHFNTGLAADMLREAAAMTTQISGETIPSNVSGCIAMSIRKPCGVVVGIAPWNAPVILGTRAIAIPLACGNTVVLKASELCPGVHRLIGEVLQASGLGDGVVNVLINAPEDAPAIVERLIAHPAVRRVNFTGSTRVGRIVGELCGRHLKPCVLELGGKAPFIVLSDADLDAAVASAAFGAFMNQGQICMSTERIIVDQSIADDFVTKFAAKAKTLQASDPATGATPLGAVVSVDTVHKIASLIEDAIAQGAKLVAGGTSETAIMDATVMDGITTEMRLFREESFGPIVAITRVNGDDEAVRVANDSEYGLSAAVFGKDTSRALQVASRIDSGICHVNSSTVHDEAQMPFGGVKASGFGRFGGRYAIHEFTDLQWITVQTTPPHYPI
jgi:acyl-CoA reductase-like NAD-dependent aldehyde dehydrogenase